MTKRKRYGKSAKLDRKEIYSIKEVFTKIRQARGNGQKEIEFDGDMVNAKSLRYKCFIKKGIRCRSCGITGRYFAKEKHLIDNLNLYGITKEGNEILMTKDHIIPKSLGGANHISNLQTMCIKCNMIKGNKYII